jgi:hypothetical protein
MIRSRLLLSALFALAPVAACDSTTTTSQANQPGLTLDVISGGGQSTLEFTELPQPIVARLLNNKGRPVKGQIVNFRVRQGGGFVWNGSAITDADGIVKDWWTVGTSQLRNLLEARTLDATTGEQITLASVLANVQQLGDVQFQCRFPPATSWDPVTNGACGSNGAQVRVPEFPQGTEVNTQVRVLNNGNPIPRMLLDFYAFGAGAAVTPVYAVTDAQGMISLTFTVGTDRQESVQVINEAGQLFRYFDIFRQ